MSPDRFSQNAPSRWGYRSSVSQVFAQFLLFFLLAFAGVCLAFLLWYFIDAPSLKQLLDRVGLWNGTSNYGPK